MVTIWSATETRTLSTMSQSENTLGDRNQCDSEKGLNSDPNTGPANGPPASVMATALYADLPDERLTDKHTLKRLSTAMSLASDSEDEPVMSDKLSSRNSAPSFEDLKLNTVSACFWLAMQWAFVIVVSKWYFRSN